MSMLNIKNVHQKLFPSEQSKLQFAALKMEAEKTDQLRVKCEEIENKNVEKLATLLSNVGKFKKHTKKPLVKAQVAIGEFMENEPLAWVGLFPVIMITGYVGMVAGFAVGGQQVNVMPFIGGLLGLVGPIAVGVSCLLTAEKYEEKPKSTAHRELFELLPEIASSANPQLSTCMQQLYHLGSDEKIPGPFWKQCLTLLRQIHLAAKEFKFQQNHFEHKLGDAGHNDPQVYQAFESHKSFAQRYQDFVEVETQKNDMKEKEDVALKTTIKI